MTTLRVLSIDSPTEYPVIRTSRRRFSVRLSSLSLLHLISVSPICEPFAGRYRRHYNFSPGFHAWSSLSEPFCLGRLHIVVFDGCFRLRNQQTGIGRHIRLEETEVEQSVRLRFRTERCEFGKRADRIEYASKNPDSFRRKPISGKGCLYKNQVGLCEPNFRSEAGSFRRSSERIGRSDSDADPNRIRGCTAR